MIFNTNRARFVKCQKTSDIFAKLLVTLSMNKGITLQYVNFVIYNDCFSPYICKLLF